MQLCDNESLRCCCCQFQMCTLRRYRGDILSGGLLVWVLPAVKCSLWWSDKALIYCLHKLCHPLQLAPSLPFTYWILPTTISNTWRFPNCDHLLRVLWTMVGSWGWGEDDIVGGRGREKISEKSWISANISIPTGYSKNTARVSLRPDTFAKSDFVTSLIQNSLCCWVRLKRYPLSSCFYSVSK